MKIKYVGRKPEETAFGHLTGGIVWRPGESHTIADERLARRMVGEHPDVWAEDVEAPAVAVASHTALADNDTGEDWLDVAQRLQMTIEQVKEIDAAGGPGTEEGAALWLKHAGEPLPAGTRTDAKMDDEAQAYEDMDVDALKALALERGVKHHHAAGKAKIIDALKAADEAARG